MASEYQSTVAEVLEKLDTKATGLSSDEAQLRLDKYGPNELLQSKKKSPWMLLLHQFADFMILVLIAAAIISGVAGDLTDSIIIIVIVLLNAALGFVQEYRAEKAMDALKKMATLQAQVWRNNEVTTIEGTQVVPGDIVVLEAGNAVPADVRLIESHSLSIDESALTGESVAVDKHINAIETSDLPIGDRLNMGYKTTLITNGRGLGVVVATGMHTQIGSIAKLLQQDETDTPLKNRMAAFGKKLSYIILFICALLFGVGLLRGEEPVKMLLLSISLAVAAIPEALPALITIALARGAARMVKQHALIRKLPAVETLGSVSFICTDKTGTLTLNKMTVKQTHTLDTQLQNEHTSILMLCMALNHDVTVQQENELTGDPTETALVAASPAHSISFSTSS